MRNKGITLIALVITIIVMLILAGVTISIVVGDNGVLTRATEVELEWSKAEIQEALELLIHNKLLEAYSTVNSETDSSIGDYFNEQKMIGYLTGSDGGTKYMEADTSSAKVTDIQGNEIYSRYILNATAISSKVDLYGQGSGTTDVFTLEVICEEDNDNKSTGEYKLMYYDDSGDFEEITRFYLYDKTSSDS